MHSSSLLAKFKHCLMPKSRAARRSSTSWSCRGRRSRREGNAEALVPASARWRNLEALEALPEDCVAIVGKSSMCARSFGHVVSIAACKYQQWNKFSLFAWQNVAPKWVNNNKITERALLCYLGAGTPLAALFGVVACCCRWWMVDLVECFSILELHFPFIGFNLC